MSGCYYNDLAQSRQQWRLVKLLLLAFMSMVDDKDMALVQLLSSMLENKIIKISSIKNN